MTLNETIAAAGLSGATQVSRMTGVSRQTLHNWQKSRPELLRLVLLGCLQDLKAKATTTAPACPACGCEREIVIKTQDLRMCPGCGRRMPLGKEV